MGGKTYRGKIDPDAPEEGRNYRYVGFNGLGKDGKSTEVVANPWLANGARGGKVFLRTQGEEEASYFVKP